MKTFKIISVNQAHVNLISSLANEIWHEHYTSTISGAQINHMLSDRYNVVRLSKEFQTQNIFWFVLEQSSIPVGFLCYIVEPDKIFLTKIYTYKKVHGLGLGKMALDFVYQKAIQEKKTKIYLFVNKLNAIAIKSYKRAGFVITESLVQDVGGGFVADDYRMEKNVT
jgi:ribosomal protein S18 acetylase RimI-like enzyme